MTIVKIQIVSDRVDHFLDLSPILSEKGTQKMGLNRGLPQGC